MQKKSKPSLPHKRKRSKSIMEKAWATRRLKSKIAKNLAGGLVAAKKARASLAKGTLTSENAIPRSEDFDAVASVLTQVRYEQLCSFVADMAMLRHMAFVSYNPIVVSRPQAEAIEELLLELGYTPYGRKAA